MINIEVTESIDESIMQFQENPKLLNLVQQRREQMVRFMANLKIPKLTTIILLEENSYRIIINN